LLIIPHVSTYTFFSPILAETADACKRNKHLIISLFEWSPKRSVHTTQIIFANSLLLIAICMLLFYVIQYCCKIVEPLLATIDTMFNIIYLVQVHQSRIRLAWIFSLL
jgi:hypothetical protein